MLGIRLSSFRRSTPQQTSTLTSIMKRSIILAALAMVAQPALGSEADDYYKKGTEAVSKGDIAGARAAFTKTLQLKPDHAYARYQLGKLTENKGNIIAKRRSAELAAIRVPEVAMEGVTLSEALEVLDHLVNEASKKANPKAAYSPNFMIRDPKNKLGEREVSLRLKNIPAKVALDYLLEQAGGIARYDEHAIVIRPAPQSASR